MTLLEDLAPEVDIDKALTTFRRVRDGRRRRRKVTRLGAATVTAVALISAALVVAHLSTHHHGRVDIAGPSTTRTQRPPAWPSAQAAINAYLRQFPHVRERARIKFDSNNWIVIAEGVPGFDRASVWTVGAIDFQRDASGWTQPGAVGAGMLDHCFDPLQGGGIAAAGQRAVGKRGRPHVDYVYSVTADPSWLIQAFVDGRWTTLPTDRGVYFKAHPSPPLLPKPGSPIQVRPVTADGRVPGCAATPASATTPKVVLRGIPVNAIACPRIPAAMTTSSVVIGSVEKFVLCRIGTPRPSVQPLVVVAGSAGFPPLLKALSEASQPSTREACPAYGDIPRVVFAKTSHHVYRVRIPTDGCGHYLTDVRFALINAH